MDRGAWRAAVHGVAKRQTRLSDGTELMEKVVEYKEKFRKLHNQSLRQTADVEFLVKNYWPFRKGE